MRDNLDVIAKRLGALLDHLEQKEFGTTVTRSEKNVTVNNEIRTDEPSDGNTSTYFSSGTGRKAVTNSDEWDRLSLGFVASTINIRVTGGPIEVAFANPNQRAQGITIRPDADSPFTIGGDPPIGTAFLWVQQADEATETPSVEILAYQ